MPKRAPGHQLEGFQATSHKASKNTATGGRLMLTPSGSEPQAFSSAAPQTPSPPLWLDVLPDEISARVARFVCRGRRTEALLHLARVAPRYHLAAVAAADCKLRLPSGQGLAANDELARMFAGHVPELHFCSGTRLSSPGLLANLVLESPLRRFVLDLRHGNRGLTPPYHRSWGGVQVDLVVQVEYPFRQALRVMTILKPHSVTFWGCSGAGRYRFLRSERGRRSEERLFEALKCVSEVRVRLSKGASRWVPLLSRLPGRTSVSLTSEPPLYLLQSLQEIDEVHISQLAGNASVGLLDIVMLGTAVAELDLQPLVGQHVLPADHSARLAEWFPNLRLLKVAIEAGSETQLPVVLQRLSKLNDLSLAWPWALEKIVRGEGYYRPVLGTVAEGIERCEGLSSVCLWDVDLDEYDLARILRHLGPRLQRFHAGFLRLAARERQLAVMASVAQYCPELPHVDTDYQTTHGWEEVSKSQRCSLKAAVGMLEKRCVLLDLARWGMP